jgi:arylsulfatase A-like enzyme
MSICPIYMKPADRRFLSVLLLSLLYRECVMRPNIVFFFSDQQRYDSLGCNGQSLPVTPILDEFARTEATNFTHAVTVQPVCGPARSALQTGLYPTQTGCYRNAISINEQTKALGHYMSEAGYSTAYVGKWHLGSDIDNPDCRTETIGPVRREKRGGYRDYWMVSDILELTSHGYDGYVFDKDNRRVDFTGYRADCITGYAVDFIRDYDEERPFFLFISNLEPHQQNDHNNFEAPDGYRELFSDYEKPADLSEGVGDWEAYYPDYLGCCRSLDENFGRVIEALKEKGLYDNTTVIYTSDHGCHFRTRLGECTPGGYDDYKRNSFENTIRIPLLIKGEGFVPGAEEHRVVSNINLPITLMSIAGCTIPDEVHGRSLQHIASADDWESCAYTQISESYVGRMVRTDDYKYVIYDPDRDPWHESAGVRYRERYLFDLKQDPLETRNLLHVPEYREIREQLKLRLREFAREAGEGELEIVSEQ